MKRLTEKRGDQCFVRANKGGATMICAPGADPAQRFEGEIVDRLAAIEDILGDEYDLEDLKKAMWCMQTVKMAFADDTSTIERLRELAQADRLIGSNVYEPNKRGFISVYEIISVHISKCSILVGWNLIDGVYSNLNGFEISALGKTVFLTREDAEAALRREQE